MIHHQLPMFLLIFCFSVFLKPSLSDPRATQAALVCSNSTASNAERQTFISNFLDAMNAVTPPVSQQGYGTVVNGTGNTTVYAFGECMKDLDQNDCNLCFAQCKTQILRCLPFQLATRGGRLFYDGCYLRYDRYNFFNESLTQQDRVLCAANDAGGGVNSTVFRANTMELVRNLSVLAPGNEGFFVGSVNKGNVSVFGLAQCWEFVNRNDCGDCLADAVQKIDSCPPKEEGRVMNAGCYMRYSTERFYNNSTPAASPPGDGGGRKKAKILGETFAAVAFVLIVAAAIYFGRSYIVKKRRERKQLGALAAAVNKSKLNFSYETLERATNYFHLSNKLGQGGSGTVYKGVLPDGRVVAVKRLFFNTRQWVDHFFNEINLISEINHTNLVKLLGCSITGPESLLVYEYVPNQSLHDYLFVRKDVQPLSWEARFIIILGTAKGLAYLHEESTLRIIHRDIKLSNVLLEDDFTPKIADFGLARLFPEDKTHISTAIAGTLGYMAPEYVVRGKLTEKADVYSFGVLVIEVICGKKNTAFSEESVSILQMVWDHYRTGKLCEAVDPILNGNFREEEVSRLLQIGLLCVQASAELRPSMSTVVTMLTDNPDIPQPSQPPFINTTGPNIPPAIYTAQNESYTQSSGNSMTQSTIDPR